MWHRWCGSAEWHKSSHLERGQWHDFVFARINFAYYSYWRHWAWSSVCLGESAWIRRAEAKPSMPALRCTSLFPRR